MELKKMDIKMFVLMNHLLSKEQRVDAIKRWGITEFVQPPKVLQDFWKNIPPTFRKDEIQVRIEGLIRDWVGPLDHHGNSEILLVAGESTATYCAVKYFIEKINSHLASRFCVAATTQRDSVDVTNNDGSITKKSVFKFVRFRVY